MKIKFLALLFVGLTALAQSVNPVQTDWRYSVLWDNVNPPGRVSYWTVYASNSMTIRTSIVKTASIELDALLNKAPEGIYSIYSTATDTNGISSVLSTNFVISWTGRVKTAENYKAQK